jgi:hypothetical protein
VPSRLVVRTTSILALAFALVALHSSPARADAKVEVAAKGLEQKAMQEDFLNTDFDKALEKLNQAAGKCGSERCSSIVRAQIKVDIGVVQIAGKQNRDAGIAAFVDALKLDSNVKVEDDLRTKDVDAAFAEAKNKVGSSSAASSSGPASSDFSVQPAPAQMVRTPLPIYATYSGTETLTKVVVKYKGFGMGEWKTLEAHSMDKGWGAEVPCADVQQGDLLYYVQGFNANNDPVATSGDRNNPFKTSVKRDFSGDAPHFPGKDPPKQCADAGDCPPDFPGCKKGGDQSDSSLKSEGQTCEDDGECSSGSCKDQVCVGGGDEGDKPKSKRSRFWLGLSAQIDFILLPSANQVCLLNPTTALPVNTSGYYCTTSGGQDFPLRSDNGVQNGQISTTASDQVQGGFAPGTFRILLSFDYAATDNLLVGAKLGYVLNTYDGSAAKNDGKAFAPIHVEARGTWVFGRDPLANAGLAPYVMVAAGIAPWDAEVSVNVAQKGPSGASGTFKAWDLSGPAFFSLGGGLRYAFTPRFAALLGPRFNVAFGNASLISLSPELGVQYGF